MIFTELKDFLVGVVEVVGYPGVFFAMVVESCLIPLPSEITMPVAGALAAEGSMNVHIAAWVGAIGNLVGSLMAYGIGKLIPEPVILKFIKKWGRFLLISEHEYFMTKNWVHKYGSFVSFFSRLIPGVRTVISLPAGVAGIPLPSFIVWTFAGSLLWSYLLTYAGYLLGDNWESMEPFFAKFQVVIIVVFVLGIGFYVYRHLKGSSGDVNTRKG